VKLQKPLDAGDHARSAETFAEADEARMRELNAEIKAHKHEHERKLCPCGCLAPIGSCDAGKPLVRAVAPPTDEGTDE
jgi:hypothetical protein